MFGISDFFGPFSVRSCPEFVLLFFLSLMSSSADAPCWRAGGGSGGGGGAGGATGTAAEATGLDPPAERTRVVCQFTGAAPWELTTARGMV